MKERAELQKTTTFEKLWAWFFAIAIVGLVVVTPSLQRKEKTLQG